MSTRYPFMSYRSAAAILAVASLCVAPVAWGPGAGAAETPGVEAPTEPFQILPSDPALPAPPPAAVPDQAQPEGGHGKEKPLTARKQQRITQKNRAEALKSLYDQLKQAQDEEGAERIAKAIERVWRQSGSDTADLLMERAGIAIQAKNLELATQILSGLTEVAPDYAEGWNQLASVYFMQEDYDKAMQGLRRVLALEPQHYKAIEGLALILREMGDKKAALRATRRALAVYPQLKSAQQAEDELRRDVEGQGI
jgi:tetratricopeptide (TPR) repeat protein